MGRVQQGVKHADWGQATAVSRIDNLEFLSDTVPRTKTYRQYVEDKSREEAEKRAVSAREANGEGGRSIQTMMQNGYQNGYQNGVNAMNGIAPDGSARPPSSHSRTHRYPGPVSDLIDQ